MLVGEGTLLEVDDGVGDAFAELADVTDIDPPGTESTAIDRKRLSQTAYKERFLGMNDLGEFQFGYEVTADNYTRINDLYRVEKNFRITFNDGLRLAFAGKLRLNRPDKVEGEKVVTARCTVLLLSLIAVSEVDPWPPAP